MFPMVSQTHLNLTKMTPTIHYADFFCSHLLVSFAVFVWHTTVATLPMSIHSVLPAASANSKSKSSRLRVKNRDFLQQPLQRDVYPMLLSSCKCTRWWKGSTSSTFAPFQKRSTMKNVQLPSNMAHRRPLAKQRSVCHQIRIPK